MDSLTTGIEILDQATGGVPRAKSVLIYGESEAGRSLAGLQFVEEGLRRGESALYICRQKPEDLIQQGEACGLDLTTHLEDDRLVVVQCHQDDLQEIIERNGEPAVLDLISHGIDAKAISRVVFDPIDAFLTDSASLGSRLDAIAGSIQTRGWTTLMLSEQTATDVILAFSQVCWGIFELQRTVGGQSQEHELLIHRMGQTPGDRLALRVGPRGFEARVPAEAEVARPSAFSRFRLADSSMTSEPKAATQPAAPPELEAEPAPDSLSHAKTEPPPATPPQAKTAVAPDAEAQNAEGAALPAPPQIKMAKRRWLTVLVVDPDGAARQQIADALSQKLRVLQASDGIEGLKLALDERPDLLLHEVNTPTLNGHGVCALLRKHEADVPVLFLSDRMSETEERVRCLMVGGDGTLSKPLEVRELRARVQRILSRTARGGASPRWPDIDIEKAVATYKAQQTDFGLGTFLARARKTGVSLCFVGYELIKPRNQQAVNRFAAILADGIRAKDSIFRCPPRRFIAVLVDTDAEAASFIVQRVNEEMAAEANRATREGSEKPEFVYHTLAVEPAQLESGLLEGDLIKLVFDPESLQISDGRDQYHGQPVDQFPLLKSIFASLHGNENNCISPLNGARFPIQTGAAGRVRGVQIDTCQYRTQDSHENSAAGLRARQGAKIVWIENLEEPSQLIGRIEDGLVFTGRGD
jgi:DNA-binding response OmpR family regulator/KaiC/GvpD/RAD55 family RecA-like ATPase